MKLILITLLFTTNLYAQHAIKIDNPNAANSEIERSTKEKACKRFEKVIRKKKWLKGEWNTDAQGSTCSRVRTIEADPEAEDQTPIEVTEHYHPENFSMSYEDRSAEIAADEAEKQDHKDNRAALKNIDVNGLDKKPSETVAEFRARRAKVIKRIIKILKRM